jgi:cytochrome subunit of sulfide dehydrogenase
VLPNSVPILPGADTGFLFGMFLASRCPVTGCQVFFLLLLAAVNAAVADEPPGSVPLCTLCHGESGPSPFPGVPTIHGLPEFVIANALGDFRDGLRPCRKSECSRRGSCPDMSMCDVAGPLQHEEVEALAGWFSRQPFADHQDEFDPDLAERGRKLHESQCEICHTRYGADPVDEASMLRGQRKAYLRTALEDFREGRRSVLPAMDAKLQALTESDLDALAEFYSGAATGLAPPD